MKRRSDQGRAAGTVTDESIRVVAFLGNPGREYARTRHNAGWMVCDELTATDPRVGWKDKFGARLATRDGVTLVAPLGFMNRSGRPVQQTLAFFNISPSRLLVVHDDLETPFGTVEITPAGGDRGHNGLRSISTQLGTREYWRARVGIGRPPGRRDPAAWVLQPFSADERERLAEVLRLAARIVEESLPHPHATSRSIDES